MSRDNRETLGATLGAAGRAYQRAVDAFDEAAAAWLGVNRTDLRCLDVLLERGDLTPGELTTELGLTSGSVTTLLDRLERLGFVERRPDRNDRRRLRVHATAAAIALVGRLWGPLVEEGAQSLARYSGDQIELMTDFLRRVTELQHAHTARVRALPPRGTRRSR